ncbi:putative amidoligase enzyme [anaerobic digester metagenome]
MSIWILICVIEAIIFALIMKWLLKEKNVTEIINKRLANLVDGNTTEMQKQKYKIKELQLSLKNADNAHNFINKCNQKPTFCHQSYMKVYQKELCYQGVSQVVYIVFYEDDHIYTREYLEEKYVDFDINRDVSRFKLECMLFIDGEQFEPSLNQPITQDSDSVKIEELNMSEHEGKGAASFYIECLSKELLRYPQIQYIKGGLSSVDVEQKDKLIHFYRKNGFENIRPMSEISWGHVTKTIRLIEENVLKLEHKKMTFGIEIEFQLRNGHTPTEIAKDMVKLELSNCEEIRDYNTIADIEGWKIIKEKTCDYEIISPVLTDTKKCWKEINLICCILTKYGAYTDNNCAFQVHIGTKDLLTEGKQWASLMDVYREFEPITCVLSKGEYANMSKRRLQCFAITMAMADTLWGKGWSIDKCRNEIEKGNLDLIPSFYRTRKIGMNWCCMTEEGKTVEFRTFNGTIDFFIIQTYLMYICNLVDKVSMKKESDLPIDYILKERNITKEYIDGVVNYLTDDNYINYRLRLLVRRCGNTLDDFTWNMLNGIGKIYVD